MHVFRGHTDWVCSVAFSPDGRTLVSGSADGTMRLWDMQTKACIRTLRSDGPYERMRITGVKGITAAQQSALKALGAVEDS